MSSNFHALDQQIVDTVSSGCSAFADILKKLEVPLKDKAVPDKFGDRNESRMLDRRLQALRKTGRLTFAKGGIGWQAARSAA